MRAAVGRLLTAPAFPDPETTRVAATLHVTALTFAVAAAAWGLGSLLLLQTPSIRLTLSAIGLAGCIGSIALLRRARVRLGSLLLVGTFWGVTTCTVVASGGLGAPAFSGYLVAIVAAGLLLGARGALGVASLSAVAGAVLGYLEAQGVLRALHTPYTTASAWWVETLFFALTAVMLVVAMDRMREALTRVQRERNFSAAVLDTVQALVVVLDREGRIVHVNRACEQLSGYTSEELRGKHPWDLARTPQHAELARSTFSLLLSGSLPEQLEVESPVKDGSSRRVAWSGTVLRGESGDVEFLIGTGIDVTERNRLQEELLQAHKLDAVGRLAGGVAHDFNNILLTIRGRAQRLLMEIAEGDPRRREVTEIAGAADRAGAVTRQLLAFSRPHQPELQVLDLNEVITELTGMLQRLIGEDVELVTDLSPELDLVQADRTHLEQVIVNLAVNARDAMPKGGRLIIASENTAVIDRPHLRPSEERWVLLTVRDTGSGMDEETRGRIFEPFFTRKEPGAGTGLGLSTVYGIVKQSGGEIRVESTPNRGTVFRVYLPGVKAEGVRPASLAGRREARSLPGGSEAILLVEDDDGVRELLQATLEAGGFRVSAAATGADALEIFETQPDLFDLVISDWVMPGMSGSELVDRIRSLRPSTKVLYISGYTDRTVPAERLGAPGTRFLEKTSELAELLQAVRSLLDSPPPAAS